MAQESADQEIVSSLKINDKGWNIQLFENQNLLTPFICTRCKCICCNAVELGCDHNDDDDIFLYCNVCLHDLVKESNDKCPIDGHDDPMICPARTIRRHISKLIVYCPYSASYKSLNNEQIKNNDKNGDIVDTFGGDYDEKEGDSQHLLKVYNNNPGGIASNAMCRWKGSLNDLISQHIISCTKQNDPSFTFKIQIKSLKEENKKLHEQNVALQNELREKTTDIEKHKYFLNDKQNTIDRLINENKRLQQLVTELQATNTPISHGNDTVLNEEVEEMKNDDNVCNEQEEKHWSFQIPDANKNVFDMINPKKVRFKSNWGCINMYWFIFGPVFKGEDNVMVEFEITNCGSTVSHGFGFATPKCNRFWSVDAGLPKHTARINCFDSGVALTDEFKAINDEESIKNALKCLSLLPSNVSKVIMSVDMKQRKGWISDGKQRVNINLPEKVSMIFGMRGTSEKIINAKIVTQ